MGSLFLSSLAQPQRLELIQKLHGSQKGKCFIRKKAIDLKLHADSIDIDHVEPIKLRGKEDFPTLHWPIQAVIVQSKQLICLLPVFLPGSKKSGKNALQRREGRT